MLFKHILVYLSLLSFAPFAWTQNVHEYHLKNGITLLVKEDHRSPIVLSEIWYKVGSSYEPHGITGISHALEHMMFRGTHHFGPGKLEQMVAENGGEQNAFTDLDFTAYYQKFSADKLALSFELEADRMKNLLLRSEDFSKEIQVVMEERRMRIDDTPQEILLERLNAAAFVANPYHHPVIGWKNDLQTMTIDDLRKWYKTWYVPNNAILVVVGDVKPKHVFQLAKTYFSTLNFLPLPRLKLEKSIPPLGEKRLTIRTPAQLPWLAMAYPVPVIKKDSNNQDPYVLDLIATLLSGGNSARFAKNLIRGQQIAAEANAFYNPISRLNNLFLLQATPTAGHSLSELESSLLQQIKQLQTFRVTYEELKRAKIQMTADKIYQNDSLAAQAYDIGSLATINLPWQISRDYLKHINPITPRQVQKVANKYFLNTHLTIAYLLPLPLYSIHTHSLSG
ncbi:peptidase M16 [Rickettsiella grylli]|uniref:M16 family metallopeptidase n=1 Tax=Rickettsiella grylli TaxID=59196 RepID=UPI0008FD2949|nr:pitrilysin family protein [Rickettsiella grylli]OJA00880.1 peptidase M16 [Rickettsiella grylli]